MFFIQAPRHNEVLDSRQPKWSIISDLFVGSIDDVKLFNQCEIKNYINCGDSLLVDKGFAIQDLVFALQARLFIPTSLGKRDRFSKEVILTKSKGKTRTVSMKD